MDLTTGREQRTVFERPLALWQPWISPSGGLLLLEDWNDPGEGVYLYETASLRLLAKANNSRGPRLVWKWTPDGNGLYLYTTDENANPSLRRIAADGETTIALKGANDWQSISPDGKALLTGSAEPKGALLLWDLPAGTRRGAIPVDAFAADSYFTPDSRTLVITAGLRAEGHTLGVWDVDGAKWLGKVPLPHIYAPLFLAPNTVVVQEGESRLACYQLRPFAKLWQHDGKLLRAIDFLPDRGRVVVLSGNEADWQRRLVESDDLGGDHMQLLDAHTGVATLDVALDSQASHTWHGRGEQFVIVTMHEPVGERGLICAFIEDHLLSLVTPNPPCGDAAPTVVRVFDIPTGTERSRINLAHAEIDAEALSPDGRTLVLHQAAGVDGSAAVFCYDLPPCRSWQFIIGIPSALGVALMLVRFGWRRLRRGRSARLPRQRGEDGPPPADAGGSLTQQGGHRMRRCICNRRLLGWSLLALLLAGLAWVLHAWLPPEPRWVLRGPITPLAFGPDGKSFMTSTMSMDDVQDWNHSFVFTSTGPLGPVQFWDIATGHENWSVLDDDEPCWQVAVSDDCTHLAAVAPPLVGAGQDELRVLDLATRQERRAAIEHRTAGGNLSFSPAGTLLMLEDWDLELDDIRHVYLYETGSLRFVAKCEVSTLPSDDKVRAEARRIRRLLHDTIETKDFADPMPLKQALQLFYEKFAAKGQDLPILVDIKAFQDAAQPNGPIDDEVHLPPVPRFMQMETALRLILSQVKSNNADYLIRGKFIEVTTHDRAVRNRWPRWRWSPDGKALLLFTTDPSGNGRLRRIAADGETITKLDGAGNWLDISPDGKTLVTEPPRTDVGFVPPRDTIWFWDLPAGRLRRGIPVDPYHPEAPGDSITFTSDSRTLLITMGEPRPGKVVGAWDLDRQQWLGRMPLGTESQRYVPEPGSVLLRDYDGGRELTWYRLRPFAKLWQRDAPGDVLRTVDYLPDLERLAVLSGEGGGNRLQLLEARTGTPTLDLALDPRAQHHWLSRGNHFAVVTCQDAPDEPGPIRAFIEEHLIPLLLPNRQRRDATPTSVRFFDPATGAERCRIDHAGADPKAISPDGGALILYQEADADGESAIICYDVPPARAWRFILGIPLGLGAALLVVRFGWRRLRRRGSASLPRQRGEDAASPADAGGSQAQRGSGSMKRICNRRVLGWSLIGLLLASLALALHAVLPPEPRWVVRGPFAPLGFGPDSKTFITATQSAADLPNKHAPPPFSSVGQIVGQIQLWDMATGNEVLRTLADGRPRWQIGFSDERTQLAATAPVGENAVADELRLVDLTTGRERRTMVAHTADMRRLAFSPGGALLLIEDWDTDVKDQFFYLFDTAMLHLLAKVRPGDRSPQWRWSPDGKAFFNFAADQTGNATLHRHAVDGTTTVSLKGAGQWVAITPDGRTLLTEPPATAPDAGLNKTILLWNLPAGTRRGAVRGCRPVAVADNRTLVATTDPLDGGFPFLDAIGVWDIDHARWLGGDTVGNLPIGSGPTDLHIAGPNSLVVAHMGNDAKLAGYRMRPFDKLWQRMGSGPRLTDVRFFPGGAHMITVWGAAEHGVGSRTVHERTPRYGNHKLQVLDVETGTPTLDLALDPEMQYRWLVSGKHFALATWQRAPAERSLVLRFIEDQIVARIMPRPGHPADTPTTTQFFDIADGTDLCRIDHPSADPEAISPDGRGLILYQEVDADGEAAIICYDVPPARAWRFILGIPLGLGVVLIGMRVGWSRLRHRRTTRPAAAAPMAK